MDTEASLNKCLISERAHIHIQKNRLNLRSDTKRSHYTYASMLRNFKKQNTNMIATNHKCLNMYMTKNFKLFVNYLFMLVADWIRVFDFLFLLFVRIIIRDSIFVFLNLSQTCSTFRNMKTIIVFGVNNLSDIYYIQEIQSF